MSYPPPQPSPARGEGAVLLGVPFLHTIFEIRNEYQKTGVTGIVMRTGLDIVSGRSWNVHEWEKQ